MADREMYWGGRQSDAKLRRAMAAELSALCESMGWDYDLVDEAGTWGGNPGRGRRQGIVIYPNGAHSREWVEEASFAFLVGEEIDPRTRDGIASRPRGEKTDPNEDCVGFSNGGFWWLADRGLMAICAFIKRLWVPSLTWSACDGQRLPQSIASLLLGSEVEVQTALRSAAFRNFLADCQMEPAGQRLALRGDLRAHADAWYRQRHPDWADLEVALDHKFPGQWWREAELTVLPFLEEMDRCTLLRSGFSTLGDLVREGRRNPPLDGYSDRMDWKDYQQLKRSFEQTSESMLYLGERTSPGTAEDLTPHIPSPSEPDLRPDLPPKPCTLLDPEDPELAAMKQRLAHLLQEDPPKTILDLYTRLGRIAQQAEIRMAVWPDLVAVGFGEGRIGLIPFGDLLASMDRFQTCFNVEVDSFGIEAPDYLNTVEPECAYREKWLVAPVEKVPESERGQVIQTILQDLLKTLADPFCPTPSRRLNHPWEVSKWLQGRSDLPWRFWRGRLVNRPWGCFRLADWTLLRELVALCANHLSVPPRNLLAFAFPNPHSEAGNKEFEPELSQKGMEKLLLGEEDWSPWWPLIRELCSRRGVNCSECSNLWWDKKGELICRLNTGRLVEPEETFCPAWGCNKDFTPALHPPMFQFLPGGRMGIQEVEPGERTSPDTWRERTPLPKLTSATTSLEDLEEI